MLPKYRCPNCDSALNSRDVLFAGPFAPRKCPSCGGQYFGGGLARALWLLCISAWLGVVLAAALHEMPAIWALPVAGGIVGALLMVRSQPQLLGRRWRESGYALAAPVALFLLLDLTSIVARLV